MAVDLKSEKLRFFTTDAELEVLRELARENSAREGIPQFPSMPIEELLANELAYGIRPEDNGASRDLVCERYAHIDGQE